MQADNQIDYKHKLCRQDLAAKKLHTTIGLPLTDKKQEANILIRITGDIVEVKGSLRFNYMFPVPDEFLEKVVINDIEDDKYRALLYKEYRFCKESAEKIQKKANKIYIMVTTNRKPLLTDNSCDFKLLEQGYRIYKDKVRQE